ncbi:hypothetical protein BC936DRAFT_145969 [Jimgerdemannia flammicorona]|uniref:D-arabinono-1,4-lactone oxidase n=1 Tax=Jimgerdemannia flammicorona TaxID=994334 RepID=A0A433D8N3_9FUNG|nr:hypothetical protein BC936DRAFT_145969 [Jimgerdemannia flammicorona]
MDARPSEARYQMRNTTAVAVKPPSPVEHPYHYEAYKICSSKDILDLFKLYEEDPNISKKLAGLIRKVIGEREPELLLWSGLRQQKKDIARNHLQNVEFTPAFIRHDIATLDQLVNLMATAEKEGSHVKAVGSFYAFGNVCETDGILVKTDLLSQCTQTDLSRLTEHAKADAEKNGIVYFEVLSGTTFADTIKALNKHNRALINLGGFTGQSIAGATSTSTHGSGINIPPLSSMIVSVHLIAPGGHQYRIEPSNGITNPTAFKSANTNVTLIQDSEVFSASVVSIGSLGISYSFTIITIPLYSLFETREELTWETVKPTMMTEIVEKHRNVEIWVNPYTGEALVTKRDIATKEEIDKYGNTISIEARKDLGSFLEHPLVKSLAEELGTGVGTALGHLMHLFPHCVPQFIDTALKSQYHQTPVVDTYDNIYPIGLANDFPAISIEILYSIKDNNHILATESAIKLLQQLRDTKKLSLTSFFSLRFVAASDQYLSMSYGETRCAIEFPILYADGHYFPEVYKPLIEDALRFGGRVHLGQWQPPSFNSHYLSKVYPDGGLTAFRNQITKFDPKGTMTNTLLRQLGLVPNSSLEPVARGLAV